MLSRIVSTAPVFLLVAARCFALILTMPLLSNGMISRRAKVALAAYLAYFILPQVSLNEGMFAAYSSFITATGSFNLDYAFLLAGEVLIGIIMGFFVTVIFGAFSTAGQFFAFQMGFSAAEAYDSLSQVENPLMGEYFNFVAMLVFLQNHWFQEIFLGALKTSFQSLNAFSIVTHLDSLFTFMLSSLTSLFANALILALPIMGSLFLINATMGILSKAAPQMNLLSDGFPILMLTGFFIITALMPYLCNFFTDCFVSGYRSLEQLFIRLGGGGI